MDRMGIRVKVWVLVLGFLISVFSVPVLADESSWPYENETAQERQNRMGWWKEARFGLFIHWGVYAVPAGMYKGHQVKGIGEWIMNRGKIPVAEYKQYAKGFNPVKYDPDSWVRLAKEAGMKYIVITSKHHDGFALYDSAVTDWDVVDATPYGKDLLKPLAQACRKHGIKLGFYYSQAQDWCHPGGAAKLRPAKEGWDNPDAERIDRYTAEHNGRWDKAQDGDMNDYIRDIAIPQVKEILTNYGDIAVLWWDTPIDMTKERADMLQPLISLEPGILTNNRLCKGYRGDFTTPEQHIPATGLDYDWEACMTMNRTWGFKSYDHDWKSTKVLIRNLVDIVSKGGNYLLNVGPTSLGEIPGPSIERLKEIGSWMKDNGESIYGTTASPFTKLMWGRCTKKINSDGVTLYLHVFDWPSDGKLVVPGLKNKIADARLLVSKKAVETTSDTDGTTILVGTKAPDAIDTVIVLKIKGQLKIEKVLPKQDASGAVKLSAIYADIHNPGYGDHAKIETVKGQESIDSWTDVRARVQWQFMIEKAGRFEIIADAAIAEAVTEFEIRLGKSKIDAKVKSTGSDKKFVEIKLGEIVIENAGEHSIEVRPIKDRWQAMNLRSLELKLLDQ